MALLWINPTFTYAHTTPRRKKMKKQNKTKTKQNTNEKILNDRHKNKKDIKLDYIKRCFLFE